MTAASSHDREDGGHARAARRARDSTRASRRTSCALGGSGARGGTAQRRPRAPSRRTRRSRSSGRRRPARPRRRPRPARARRGTRRAARARAAARARWPRPPRACGRRRPGRPAWSTPRNPSATVSHAPRRARYRATTTFRVSGRFLRQCRSSCDVPQPSSPRSCALLGAARSRPPRSASTTQSMTFEAPRDLKDPATRDAGLQRASPRSACTRCAWCSTGTTSRPSADSRVKPEASTRPIPASYDWGAVRRRRRRRQGARAGTCCSTVSGPVPRWATNGATRHAHAPEPERVPEVRPRPSGAHYGAEGRHLEHLERAQPAAVPDAAVLGAPHAAVAADLPQALPRRPARPGRCRPRQRAGAAGRDLAARHGQGRRAADASCAACCAWTRSTTRPSTSCAKLHARRLRPPRLHDGPGPDLQAHAAQRRHDRRALAADHRARPGREGRRDHRAPADLPDRVRHREHARPGARA